MLREVAMFVAWLFQRVAFGGCAVGRRLAVFRIVVFSLVEGSIQVSTVQCTMRDVWNVKCIAPNKITAK